MRLLLAINTNLLPILRSFRAFDSTKSLYLATPLAFNSPNEGVSLGRSRKIYPAERKIGACDPTYCTTAMLRVRIEYSIWILEQVPLPYLTFGVGGY